MFTQFFGNYLLNKGLVTSEQLSQALSIRKETRLRLGVLAINAGYMTPEQVDEVHLRQQQVDKRIGDIACEMGFMTPEQVDELLGSQGEAHLQLGQALINEGVMTNAAFAKALSDYKEENSLSDVDFADNSGYDVISFIEKFYSFSGEKNAQLLSEYVTLLYKNIIRFIGDDFTPDAPQKLNAASIKDAAIQPIVGNDFKMTSIICADDEKACFGFASRFAEEDVCDSEMAAASNGEFINLHNGLFAVNVSNEKSVELKLEPQQYTDSGNIEGAVYIIPLAFPFGTMRFLIAL